MKALSDKPDRDPMTTETFFEKFELFADTPNAVAKMRELVLELAVQGKLVEQMPNELSARECIRTANSPLVDVATDEATKTPAGWVALPLGCLIAANTGGGTPSKQNPSYWNGSIPWASVKDIQNEKYLVSTTDSITEEGLKGSSSNLISPNRLIVVTRMGLGKLAINTIPVAINQDLRAIEPTTALDLDFAYLLFKSLKMVGSGVTVKGITVDKLHAMPVLLPPLAEQRRIVAKVDELIGLCDVLEEQQKERETRQGKLVRAAIGRFGEAPTPANMEVLFHPAVGINPSELRKTILTLAVQGKLVAQDPVDEPAAELLKRIGLSATGLPVDSRDECSDSLPPTWTRVRFEDVAIVTGGVTLGRKLGDRKTVSLPYLRVANVKRGDVDLSVLKEVSIGEGEIERYALRNDDILMTEGGDWDKVGRAAIWRGQIPVCLHQNHVFRARLRSVEFSPTWFERYFNSPEGRSYFESSAKQTTNLASINMRQVRGCPVPVPPLAEQRRIVARVEELMGLVDQLERLLVESRERGVKLMEALVGELTAR
jgi:type I restriction enzyme S subunit